MTENIRLLAAIMFADMVGYTALMQENEAKAILNRNKYKQLMEEKTLDFQGRILQYYGDGALVIFGSAISAVECAVKIQQELQNDPKIPVRIGLHIGDIAYDDEGVFGDAVNIASRIESLAVEGSVLISEKMYDEIKNHPSLPSKFIGQFELKNVKSPVNIYALTNTGLVVPNVGELKGKAKTAHRSVAVLPFVNMSADPENEFFSDGISEEIINALSKVDGLQVTARTSSFAFKGRQDDVRSIAKTLNVSTILEGSVRKSGSRVRITAQLINAVSGFHFWSESYDGTLENIFELQDEISRKIANKLIEQLAVSKVTSPLVKTATTDVDAYNHYLKGLHYWNKWNPADNLKAIDEFNEAIRLAPMFARAYAWLSNCYMLSGAVGFQKSSIVYPQAKEYALKAMELEPNDWECNISIGLVCLFVDWDFEGARRAFERALEINPGAAGAHHTYSLYLTAVGRTDEALKEIEMAARLDPLSLPIGTALATCLFVVGRIDEGIEQLDKVLELDPTFRNALEMKGIGYFVKGESDTAITILKQYHQLSGGQNKAVSALGYVYARCGCSDKSTNIIEILKKRELEEPGSSFNIDFAFVYTGLRDYDKAFYYLEKAVDERSGAAVFLRSSMIWTDLRDDPRFTSILKKIGLPS